VLDSDGSVLASRGLTQDEAAAMSAQTSYLTVDGHGDNEAPWRTGRNLVVPLDLRQGHGAMVIVAGGMDPMFGDDELSRLRQYSASITAGLDRVTLNSKIAALERAKTDFLNIASHELRGPMTVIKGYLTMLESGALGEMSPKARSVLPLLITKSDEVNWMVEQMIEASRLEEGRLALKTQRMDIVELTDSAVDGVRMLLSDHGLKLVTPPEAIEAKVDPDRFQIVVRNLLSNAAKYSPAGSDINVDVGHDESAAFVKVSDQGVGIAPEDQANLFTRFSRIETGIHIQGTGLGCGRPRDRPYAQRRPHRFVKVGAEAPSPFGAAQQLSSARDTGRGRRFEPARPLDLRSTPRLWARAVAASPGRRDRARDPHAAGPRRCGSRTMARSRCRRGDRGRNGLSSMPRRSAARPMTTGFVPAHPLLKQLHRQISGIRMPRTQAVFEAWSPPC
jgi:signal transduction histidine kinase